MADEQIHAVTMPKWGLSMTEGRVVEWQVEEGSPVQPGDELLDVETDKIAGAVEATEAGVLRRRVARPDQLVPALQRARADERPSVVCVKTNREANLIPPDAEAFAEVYTGVEE